MGPGDIWTASLVLMMARLQYVAANLVLSSQPPSSSGRFCGGPVVFTCTGTETAIIFNWEVNDSCVSQYIFKLGHNYPRNLSVTSLLLSDYGVEVAITNAILNLGRSTINITSTFSVPNASDLNGMSLHCEDGLQEQSNTMNIVVISQAPSAPTPNCTVQPSSAGLKLALQWSELFNSRHAVERYRVTVTPGPSSCSSDQVSPSEDYSCSELDLGIPYSISYHAYNCMDREGEVTTISVELQNPETPTGIMVDSANDPIRIQWNDSEVAASSFSSECTFDTTISYTIVILDSSGQVVTEEMVMSDNCSAGFCSITFPSDQYCGVRVTANNVFGESIPAFANIASVRLTVTNLILIVVGIVLCTAAAAMVIALIVILHQRKTSSKGSWIVLLCGVVLVVVSVVLWVAVAIQVGLQDNTCEAAWQSSRDGLIIASFIFSVISVVMTVVAAILTCLLVVTSSSVNIKNTHNTKETWRMKLEETEETDLKPSKAGIVKALEAGDVMVDEGFKKIGESTTTGILRTKEEVHQKYSAALQHDSHYAVTQHNIPLVPPQNSNYSSLATHEEGKKEEYSSLQHGKSKAGGDKEKALLQHHKTKASGERKQEEYSSLQHEKGKDKAGGDKEKEKYSHLQHHKTKAGSESKKEEYSVLQHQKDKAGEKERKEEYSVQKDETTVAQRMSDADSRLYEYLCISMWKHNKYLLRKKGTPPPPEQVAAWFPEDRRWPVEQKDKLKVYFKNECPREWKCREDVLTRQRIMELLDETWWNCFAESKHDPHIRVAFEGDGAHTWSALGTVAKSIPKDKPTMVLNFSNMKDDEIIATIVHQFGHALGLGHALMKPEDWHVLRKYVDQRQMMEFYGSPTMEEFEVQWTGKGLKEMVNYDEGSVMQYRTELMWLNEVTYRTIQGINESTLSKTDKMKLKIFNKHARSSKAKPSANDLETLNIETKPEEPEYLPKDLPQESQAESQEHRKLFQKEPLTREEPLTKEDFLTVKAGATLSLTHKLAPAWKAIGEKLRMRKEVLAKINGSSTEDAERLMSVWVKWLDRELPSEKYPPTREGLYRLLDACGHKTIADEHFKK